MCILYVLERYNIITGIKIWPKTTYIFPIQISCIPISATLHLMLLLCIHTHLMDKCRVVTEFLEGCYTHQMRRAFLEIGGVGETSSDDTRTEKFVIQGELQRRWLAEYYRLNCWEIAEITVIHNMRRRKFVLVKGAFIGKWTSKRQFVDHTRNYCQYSLEQFEGKYYSVLDQMPYWI